MGINNYNILIAGGGTGGHIFPGISIYEEFKNRNIKAAMLVGVKDASFSPLAKIDAGDLFFYRAPSFTKNIFMMPFFIFRFCVTMLKSAILLRKHSIDAVIGMGGYVSAPVLAAALLLKKKIFLCEQNSVPGKVTLLFASRAAKIFSTLEGSREYFKGDIKTKIINAGNPLRNAVFVKETREEARKFFYLKHCKKVILVIGGSQGAVQVNELFLEIKKLFPNELKDTGIIWITGNHSFMKYKKAITEAGLDGSTYIAPFIDNVGLAYKAADLAISRSGAGGIMEFAATGLPSVLIPYPHAADNHQEKNAEEFAKAGAAVMIRNSDAIPEKAGNVIIDLLSNPVQLSRMSQKAKSLAKINAAGDIVKEVVEELN